ncbi:MAG: IS1096 element passenger TnpR family protein [Janthinobacterium lividum]
MVIMSNVARELSRPPDFTSCSTGSTLRRAPTCCALHMRFRQLHLIIQSAFNCRNYHLHEFKAGGHKRHVCSVLSLDPGLSFTYGYDFGNHRCYTITLGKSTVLEQPIKVATSPQRRWRPATRRVLSPRAIG